MGTSVVKW